MIRFCDKEICCVEKDTLNRLQLIDYFLNGHRAEQVYVIDADSKYVGSITYESLLGRDLEDAICRDYLILDETIWENGRKYMVEHKWNQAEPLTAVLPVLNKDHQLICFAWQDDEANRELRMLDELVQCSDAVTFKELYSEYDAVVLHGCNELAYYFAAYLRKLGITVLFDGMLWKEFDEYAAAAEKTKDEFLDYRLYDVYSEGIAPVEEIIELRESVSSEFECIDRIYEENIRKGAIKDTEECLEDLLQKLNGKQIGILGTSQQALDAYDLLLGYGIDIDCFVENKEKKLLDKQVLNREEAMKMEDIVFIDPYSKYSAWGFGGTDNYYYLGYRRNEQFILLSDYTEIPHNGLQNVLSRMLEQNENRLILIGDPWLSLKLKKLLGEGTKANSIKKKIVCCDILGRGDRSIGKNDLQQIDVGEISEKDNCLLLLSEQYACFDYSRQQSYYEMQKQEIAAKIRMYAAVKIIPYISENIISMEIENAYNISKRSSLKVDKIIIGAHEFNNGNFFFRSLLDGHPDIIMLDDGYLNANLYSICIRLSAVKSQDILPLFWKLCYMEAADWRRGWIQTEIVKFNQSMEKMLSEKETFASQELFTMIHIAYARMLGKEVQDSSNLTIYWEPHGADRNKMDDYAKWLSAIADSWYIVKVIRNYSIRTGSLIKYFWNQYGADGINVNKMMLSSTVANLYSYIYKDEKEFDHKKIIVKFENIKLEPRKELAVLCDRLNIKWSDTLLETTHHGKSTSYGDIKGFDLKPVYCTNDEYFSSFDHFRTSLLAGWWQKKYGYPFANSLDFSRRELLELFKTEFRFEERFTFEDEKEKKIFQSQKSRWASICLWMARRMEVMEKVLPTEDHE